MNTINETLARLTALASALQTLQDNYGIRNEAGFNEQKGELADIIANIDVQPPAPPVTVADVTADISASLLVVRDAVGTDLDTFQVVISDLAEKVDALVALANTAGEPVAA